MDQTGHWTPSRNPDTIVIPGLDVNASDHDQIDQIDQLITIKLQNIDANLSKFQNTIHSRVLPALKRYAETTEPIRETAKFWVEFFEMAANVRMDAVDDASVLYEDSQQDAGSLQATPDEIDDGSFITAAISSTPMSQSSRNYASKTLRDGTLDRSDTSEDPSWAASVESPFERLDRQFQGLQVEPDIPTPSSASSTSAPISRGTVKVPISFIQRPPPSESSSTSVSSTSTTNPTPVSLKGKGRATPSNLRQNVLRQNLLSAAEQSTPRRRNPFIPRGTDPKQWNGIVDLRRDRSAQIHDDDGEGADFHDSDDDSDLGIEPASQITLKYAPLSPRVRAAPAPNAAERVMQHLIASAAAANQRGPSSSISSADPSSPNIPRVRPPKKSLGFTANLAQLNWSATPQDDEDAYDSDSDSWEDDDDDQIPPDLGVGYQTDTATGFGHNGEGSSENQEEETLFGLRPSYGGGEEEPRGFMLYANQALDEPPRGTMPPSLAQLNSPTPWSGANRDIGG